HPQGGGASTFGSEDGPPQRDVRGRARSGPRPNRATGHLGNRREDRPGRRRRDPQSRQDRLHIEGNPGRVPASIDARRGGASVGSLRGLARLIFNRATICNSGTFMKARPISSRLDGWDMRSAMDLIGRNHALQEHWIRRVLAFVIDALIVFAIGRILPLPLSILAWTWH